MTESYFSQSWSLGSPSSRQIWCLLRAHFLVHSWVSFCYNLTWQERLRALWSLFDKALITFVAESPPRGPSTITLGIRLQDMNLGDTATVSVQHVKPDERWGDHRPDSKVSPRSSYVVWFQCLAGNLHTPWVRFGTVSQKPLRALFSLGYLRSTPSSLLNCSWKYLEIYL